MPTYTTQYVMIHAIAGQIRKMKKVKTYAPRELSKLKRKLDIVFAPLIRDRDKKLGCIACGKKTDLTTNLQAGHFIRRGLMTTRWNPINVNGECARCNVFLAGNIPEYAIGLDKKYGEGTAKNLTLLSRGVKQWSGNELLALIVAGEKGLKVYEEVYKELTKDLN